MGHLVGDLGRETVLPMADCDAVDVDFHPEVPIRASVRCVHGRVALDAARHAPHRGIMNGLEPPATFSISCRKQDGDTAPIACRMAEMARGFRYWIAPIDSPAHWFRAR